MTLSIAMPSIAARIEAKKKTGLDLFLGISKGYRRNMLLLYRPRRGRNGRNERFCR